MRDRGTFACDQIAPCWFGADLDADSSAARNLDLGLIDYWEWLVRSLILNVNCLGLGFLHSQLSLPHSCWVRGVPSCNSRG